MLGQPFAGTVWEHVRLEEVAVVLEKLIFLRVVRVKETGVIQIFGDPVFDVTQLPEIDHEAVHIRLRAPESQRNRPIVPVYQRTMPVVFVLAMRKRNVPVTFFAGYHCGLDDGWVMSDG
jgi:hypothetical protein